MDERLRPESWRAVRAQRRGVQAVAVRELETAEAEVRDIEQRLHQLMGRLEDLQARRSLPTTGAVTRARLLESDHRARRRAGDARRRLSAEIEALRVELEGAEARAAAALDAVADATYALGRLDELKPR